MSQLPEIDSDELRVAANTAPGNMDQYLKLPPLDIRISKLAEEITAAAPSNYEKAVALELYHGNVHLLIAAAIWLGFSYPAAWAFVVLTKVTPGVGLIWFAVRREWRSLAIALGVTGVLVAVSFLIDGRLWESWLRDSLEVTAGGSPLDQFSIPVPLWIRVPAALALVGWGGLTDRRWTVPVGATLALPVLWPSGFAVLAALWPIWRERGQRASGSGNSWKRR